MLVYKYTNTQNGKVYVGITSRSLEKRHSEHIKRAGDGTYFHNAIRYYGAGSFVLEIIDSAKTKIELAEKEIRWIKELNSFAYWPNSSGYNETTGGEGVSGASGCLNSQYGVSPLERIGEENYDEWKRNLSKSAKKGKDARCYGLHPSEIFGEEGWKKTRELARERWSGDQNPQKLNPKFGKDHPNYNQTWSQEVKIKMSRGKTNKKVTEKDVVEIRISYASGKHRMQDIADEYGICRQTVGEIINGDIYKHVQNDFDYAHARAENENRRTGGTKL